MMGLFGTVAALEERRKDQYPLIRIATCNEEIQTIGRFRYRQYVEEKRKPYTNVANGVFLDEVDSESVNFFSMDDDHPICAVRLTTAICGLSDPQLRHLVRAYEGSVEIDEIVLCSRFTTAKHLSARRRINQLLELTYEVGSRAGAKQCRLGTRPELCSIFERFGFHRKTLYSDPVVGQLMAMELDLHDYEHMSRIKSPLLSVARYLEDSMHVKSSEYETILACVRDAQTRFAELLESYLVNHGTTVQQYARFLSMEYHLTKGVQRYFLNIASHGDLAKRRQLRAFLVRFANEEELHYLVAANDLHQLGKKPTSMPFDAELWHAYFEKVTSLRPFVRLGAACILENISAGLARPWVKKALQGSFLTPQNTKFLVLHQHEVLPHGDQILEAVKSAELEPRHFADLVHGARRGTILYLRLAEWALKPDSLGALADQTDQAFDEEEEERVAAFEMKELEHEY
jgi:hypothetical protein